MQDRNRQLDENLLQRTAGPYMRVKKPQCRASATYVRYSPSSRRDDDRRVVQLNA
jgi:hypothetical protein